ncbi:MAG: cyclic nucleotide-binding domain-containing protein, partial [Deltaproteobacteria bacterium]|nr:cyclic nucleotide-binding domain-containing protein [Deltaproteobacteria bacterium]
HQEALRRLAQMNEQLGAGPTRAAGMADNNPGLHENPNVAALRRPGNTMSPRAKPTTNRTPTKEVTGRIPIPVVREPSGRTAMPKPAIGVGAGATPRHTPVVKPPLSAQTQPIRGPYQQQPPQAQPPRPQPQPQRQPQPQAQPQPQPQPQPQTQTQPVKPVPQYTQPLPRPQVHPAVARTISPNLGISRSMSGTPQVAMSRTKSKPISLPPGAALDTVNFAEEFAESHQRDQSSPGIHVIPLDDGGSLEMSQEVDTYDYERVSAPVIEVEAPDEHIDAEVDEFTDLELDDIEEIPLPEPLYMGIAAHRALQATPLFAGLPSDALESLVENLAIVHLEPNEVLFHEGDPGDALYVIVEGEVSVQAEGPPRVEMARLGAGSFIGEVALMTDQPRSATVAAVNPSELLRIDRNTLGRVLADHGDVLRAVLRFVRDRLVDRWMRTSPLFRPFDESQRAELAAKFNFLEIETGTRLIEMGTRPDGLYIVLAGKFIVERGGTILATLGAGELIGETALLSGGAFKSNVTANGKSLALHLPAGEFREIIMTHPHVLEYIGEHAEHSRRLQIL